MDWDNIWWDIDGDNDSTADGAAIGADDFAFTADKISNTTVVSGTTLTATLTADAKAALHAVAGFGADGVTDNASDEIDILLASAVTLPATLVLMMRMNWRLIIQI